jgi:hypothetical protein
MVIIKGDVVPFDLFAASDERIKLALMLHPGEPMQLIPSSSQQTNRWII